LPRTSDSPSDFHTPERLIPSPEVVSCPACGHENPASHKFCGSCGSKLRYESEPAERSNYGDTRYSSQNSPEETRREARRESQAFETSITNPHELSLFRSFRPNDSDPEGDLYDEPRSPYRVYIAIVLALMIGGLVYMGWRSAKSSAPNARETPPAPATAEKSAAPAAAPLSRPADAGATKTPEADAKGLEAASPKSRTSENALERNSGAPAKHPPATPDSAVRPPATEMAPTQTEADNGSAELAQARRYLGRGDGADAAKWLWKSISKHNGEATVALADLYLKGEGVSKNCDQAHVLLDSAARKGVSGAGERLRNLQAFGCQ
jgi:hypothetical protein